jgi:hypothetical protein
MKTDEDDEFDRIKRENALHEVYRLGQEIEASGQPYHWETDAIKAAVQIEREACARICESTNILLEWPTYADAIRARGNTCLDQNR